MPVLAALSVGAATFAAWTLAQTPSAEPLAQYGLAGVVIVVLFTFARTTVTRTNKQLDDERAYNRQLNERVQNEIIPAALKLAEVAERLTRYTESKS